MRSGCTLRSIFTKTFAPYRSYTIRINRWHPLEKLYISSDFDDEEINLIHTIKFAQFLDLHFPNLSILETYEAHESRMVDARIWGGIQQTRVALQAARIDAIRRANLECQGQSASGRIFGPMPHSDAKTGIRGRQS